MYIEKKKKRIKNYRVAILKVSFRSPKQRGSTRPCFWPPHLGRRYYSGLPTTDGRILDTTTPVTAYLLFWERATRERTPSTAFVSIAISSPIVYKKKLDRKLDAKVARLMRFLTCNELDSRRETSLDSIYQILNQYYI